jgi:hypothetical protein
VGQDGAAYKSDLGETRSEKYLHMGLDRGMRVICLSGNRRASSETTNYETSADRNWKVGRFNFYCHQLRNAKALAIATGPA